MSVPAQDRPAAGPGQLHEAIAAEMAWLGAELVELRRDLHAHPEPSWEEHRTTAVLLDRLAAAGLPAQASSVGTGVVLDIGAGGPLVAIRGDIDALRMPDVKAVPYRSTVAGVCHACGHDLHTAAAFGAGVALHRVLAAGGVPGRVRLILQPAEESLPSGARAMVEAGVMDGVQVIFALHCDPGREVGTVGLSEGPITSASDLVEIRLKGPGGHTGRPHMTADLVHIAARVAVDLPMGLNRLSDPRDGINLTFGSIHAGEAGNVIPTEARLLGSLRAIGRRSWEAAPPIIESLVRAIVEPLGASFELHHQVGGPPIVNDRWATRLAARAAEAVVGAAAVSETEQSGGGEDFSLFLDHAPGCYLRLGVRTAGQAPYDIHTGAFDVDEAAIPIAARLLAGAAVEALADLATPPAA
jgi:amidohydrolase